MGSRISQKYDQKIVKLALTKCYSTWRPPKKSEKLSFFQGTSGFINEARMEPLQVPDTSPIKSIKLQKQRWRLSHDEQQEAECGDKEGNEKKGMRVIKGMTSVRKGRRTRESGAGWRGTKKEIDCECADSAIVAKNSKHWLFWIRLLKRSSRQCGCEVLYLRQSSRRGRRRPLERLPRSVCKKECTLEPLFPNRWL